MRGTGERDREWEKGVGKGSGKRERGIRRWGRLDGEGSRERREGKRRGRRVEEKGTKGTGEVEGKR